MKIEWTEPARRDLREIYLYIAQDNPHLGRLGRIDGTRELVMANSPYILPYRIRQDRIEILAVYHGARIWPKQF